MHTSIRTVKNCTIKLASVTPTGKPAVLWGVVKGDLGGTFTFGVGAVYQEQVSRSLQLNQKQHERPVRISYVYPG